MNSSTPALGIDLGTTNAVIAMIRDDGSWECIPNQEGQIHTPSVVQITEHGFRVGQHALDEAELHPNTVIQEIKRHMGDPDWAWVVDQVLLQPEDISALILQKLHSDASNRLGLNVRDVVVSVPAHFSENQRRATMEAIRLGGFRPLRLINEPSAAALAYGYQNLPNESLIFVLDLGGGTCDVSILLKQPDNLQVLSTRGHAHLGGKDWDDLLLHQAAAQFIAEHGLDPLDDPHCHQRLRRKVIEAKHRLSTHPESSFVVRCQNQQSKVSMTRANLEELSKPLFGQMEDLCRLVLRDIERPSSAIAQVLLVGGATRMPGVQQIAHSLFPQASILQDYPEKAVAYGAALQAFWMQKGAVIAPRQNRDPNAPSSAFQTPQSNTPRSKMPLYLKGDVSHEEQKQIPLSLGVMDVNSHRLGLVVLNAQGKQQVDTLIEKFSPLPFSHKATYYTAYDHQISLEIEVVEGESPYPSECIPLGKATIEGLPPRPAGQAINVEFTYNVSGLLQLTVFDIGSGQRYEQEIQSIHQSPTAARQRVRQWLKARTHRTSLKTSKKQ